MQGCGLVGIMEMWWDGLHDWRVAVEGVQATRERPDQVDEEGELSFL